MRSIKGYLEDCKTVCDFINQEYYDAFSYEKSLESKGSPMEIKKLEEVYEKYKVAYRRIIAIQKSFLENDDTENDCDLAIALRDVLPSTEKMLFYKLEHLSCKIEGLSPENEKRKHYQCHLVKPKS